MKFTDITKGLADTWKSILKSASSSENSPLHEEHVTEGPDAENGPVKTPQGHKKLKVAGSKFNVQLPLNKLTTNKKDTKMLYITLGGTISAVGESAKKYTAGEKKGKDLLPDDLRNMTVDILDLLDIDSKNMQPKHFFQVRDAIVDRLNQEPSDGRRYDGIVISTGTDKFHNLATFLKFNLGPEVLGQTTVVLTAAMAPAEVKQSNKKTDSEEVKESPEIKEEPMKQNEAESKALDPQGSSSKQKIIKIGEQLFTARNKKSEKPDGPGNLSKAFYLAKTKNTPGVFAEIKGKIYIPPYFEKKHTTSVHGGLAGGFGPVNAPVAGTIKKQSDPSFKYEEETPARIFELGDLKELPVVAFLTRQSTDPKTEIAGIKAFVDATKAEGLVYAGGGNGAIDDEVGKFLGELATGGFPIVRTTIVNDGGVTPNDAFDDKKNNTVCGGILHPEQLVLLTQLTLAESNVRSKETSVDLDPSVKGKEKETAKSIVEAVQDTLAPYQNDHTLRPVQAKKPWSRFRNK